MTYSRILSSLESRALPRNLGSRIIILLALCLFAIQTGNLIIYHLHNLGTINGAFAGDVVGRLATAAPVVTASEPSARDQAAHAMSSDLFGLHWERTARVQRSGSDMEAQELLTLIDRDAPAVAILKPRIIVSKRLDEGQRVVIGTLSFEDGSFLNFEAHQPSGSSRQDHAALIWTSIAAAGVGLFAMLMVRRLSAPLTALSSAVDAIGYGPTITVSEFGPIEVQHLARRFNHMQRRIAHLIEDRTNTLAAVSHDLRTPITRLRLLAAFIGDAETQGAIDRDLEEMESMIDATLCFLRDGDDGEEAKRIDLAALIVTLVDDAIDAGFDVAFSGPRHLSIATRALSLKRALSNVINNAVTYGTQVNVRLEVVSQAARIIILDDGPGIPEEDLISIFEPFKRLDASRASNVAGAGLGLSIARQAINREGGTVSLHNRPSGGLMVDILLPMPVVSSPALTNRPKSI